MNQLWFTVPVAIVVVIALLLALLGWRRWHMPGAPAFMAAMLAVVEWGAGYGFEIAAPTLAQKLFWAKFEYVGIVTLPVAWFLFAYRASEYRLPRPWRAIGLLGIIPLITVALAWTTEQHGLIYQSVHLDTSGPFVALDATYGPWFWAHSLYSYSLMGAGSILLLRHVLRAPRLYRLQIGALLVGIIAPWVANAAYLWDLSPIPNLDITIFAFAFTGVLFAYSLLRYRLLDLRPVARDALIEGMRDGVIVVDAQQRVVDLNPAARRILTAPNHEVIGLPLEKVLPLNADEIFDPERCPTEVTQITLNQGAEERHYDLTVSLIRTQRERPAGHVLVLHDNTQRIQAEVALRESEGRYRAVSEMTSDYTFAIRIAPSGKLELEWVTNAFTPVTGYTITELIADGGWERLIYPDDLPVAQEFLATLLRGVTTSADFRVVSRDGAVRWMRSYGRPEWDAARRHIVRFLAASHDITARTEALQALQESESRYRLLFESSPHPMWVYDQETLRFLAVNAAAIEHYGYTRDEFLQMTIMDIRPPSQVAALQQHLAGIRPGTEHSSIWRHRTRNGTLIDVEITSHPIVFDGHQGKVVLAQDITARRRTEQALLQQYEYLAALHETTLSIIQRFDVSDVLEAIVVRAGALVGTAHGYIYLVDRDPATGAEALFVQIGVGIFRSYKGFKLERGEGLGGKVWESGQPLVANDYDRWEGRSHNFKYGRYSATAGVPLTSKDRVIGVIGLSYLEPGHTFEPSAVEILTRFAQLASLALDNARLFTTAQAEIAERKRAEAELALARDQALEAARLKSEFLAIMSHELRTPLNAIIGFSELLQQQAIGPLNRDQQRSMERVVRNAIHLRDMINDMLDLNKLDADGMRLLHEPFWLPEVVESAAHSVEMQAAAKHLRFEIQPPPPGIPLLHGDAGRLRQVVLNLLSNAIKFTPEHGNVCVAIEHGASAGFRVAAAPTEGVPAGYWIALTVQDTGIGIDPAEHERIWHEFYQGDTSTTRQYGGTGLGLAIVRRLVARMGGKIGLRSARGAGATFTIWLPIAAPQPAPRANALPATPELQTDQGA